MTQEIYGLFDPRIYPVTIRYVGYTSKGADKRLVAHICGAKKVFEGHKNKWIRSLIRDGIRPSVKVLESFEEGNWQEKERFWISKFQGQLTNSTVGGEGLINPTEEIRQRISEKVTVSLIGNSRRLGVKHTAAHKKSISDALRASDKFKAANAAKRGKNCHTSMTEEQKAKKSAKIRASKLGVKRKPFTTTTLENMRLGHIGLKHSEETKKKIGLSSARNERAKGHHHTTDAKERISGARIGSKFITNGHLSKVLKAGETLPDGWIFGMKSKGETNG